MRLLLVFFTDLLSNYAESTIQFKRSCLLATLFVECSLFLMTLDNVQFTSPNIDDFLTNSGVTHVSLMRLACNCFIFKVVLDIYFFKQAEFVDAFGSLVKVPLSYQYWQIIMDVKLQHMTSKLHGVICTVRLVLENFY